jgi:raffinose/stachyose/melibiose transport system permease protein
MKPATATCLIITTMFVWNDFITPMVIIDEPLRKPIPPSVFVFFGQYWTKWNYCFAGLALAMLPLFALFLSLQKQFIKGVTSGALKG